MPHPVLLAAAAPSEKLQELIAAAKAEVAVWAENSRLRSEYMRAVMPAAEKKALEPLNAVDGLVTESPDGRSYIYPPNWKELRERAIAHRNRVLDAVEAECDRLYGRVPQPMAALTLLKFWDAR